MENELQRWLCTGTHNCRGGFKLLYGKVLKVSRLLEGWAWNCIWYNSIDDIKDWGKGKCNDLRGQAKATLCPLEAAVTARGSNAGCNQSDPFCLKHTPWHLLTLYHCLPNCQIPYYIKVELRVVSKEWNLVIKASHLKKENEHQIVSLVWKLSIALSKSEDYLHSSTSNTVS